MSLPAAPGLTDNLAMEVPMPKILLGLGLLVATILPAQALCVSERDIVSTTPSNDGRQLTFKLRDGRVLVNHLQGRCSDLRFNGFVWVLRGNNDICENMQSLRVIQSGQTCLLGKFVSVGKTRPAAPPTAP
jgi:hypothetical protein